MPNKSSGSSAGILWLIQAISGLLLVILLGVHMIANHFIAEGGLRVYADVVAYISNPVILVWETIFLIVVTLHAALGLRAVILDLNPSAGVKRALNWALSVLGIIAVVYGVWLTLSIRG